MKNIVVVLVCSFCVMACATTTKLANKAISNGIVGQNESTINSRLGYPVRTISKPNGEKTLVYEYYSRSGYKAPANVKSKSFRVDEFGHQSGLDIGDVISTLTYDSSNAISGKYTTYLEVYLDKQGNCVGFEHNLTKEQLQLLREQFKRYQPTK
ncbi:hypothetical protein [Mangrovibacterium diazotrophicum]|uniref:Beta-barrel assembly machine subunit BamE n=1 Tax=Mangrovibacterium diazotrophicum TaxID=1261403 RepID=A0A419W404_9BACT|nr:hypothetical protein [Mangrovibacterium diazotrophicum]RKD90177.1 hypothetical protein BC643_0513 [Mangrovibacterium diazotrophicum]